MGKALARSALTRVGLARRRRAVAQRSAGGDRLAAVGGSFDA